MLLIVLLWMRYFVVCVELELEPSATPMFVPNCQCGCSDGDRDGWHEEEQTQPRPLFLKAIFFPDPDSSSASATAAEVGGIVGVHVIIVGFDLLHNWVSDAFDCVFGAPSGEFIQRGCRYPQNHSLCNATLVQWEYDVTQHRDSVLLCPLPAEVRMVQMISMLPPDETISVSSKNS